MDGLPVIAQQLIGLAVIAVAMVFGSHLYRRRADRRDAGPAARRSRPASRRPRKKR